jgi:5-methylcytosine-specific restriction enzyme subunit McrC
LPAQLLTESTTTTVRLSDADAAGLQALGRRLSSTKTWWGDDGQDPSERTVIRVSPLGDGEWTLRVADAVGAVAVGDATFIVEPKIPNAHLLHLLACSGHVPRLDPQRTSLASDQTLWDLVAAWFTEAAEAVLRQDLIRDYRDTVESLPLLRGRAHPLPTSRALLKGRIEITCEFDEFDADNALNRVLLAAASKVAASPVLPDELRRRAQRVALRLDGISDLRPGDLRAVVDRRTWYYRDAHTLGRSVLSGGGRALAEGPEPAWTFLIRTPEMVEAGVRQILADGLHDHSVTKQGLQLAGSTKTLNPDLVFDGGTAVGDVKYKITGTDWNTADLYQTVAFATGYRASKAVVISFSPHGGKLPTLQVGDVEVSHIPWQADSTLTPSDSATLLIEDLTAWLGG